MRSLLPALIVLVLSCAPVKFQYQFLPADPHDTLPPWAYPELVQGVLTASSEWKPKDVKTLELLAWYAKVDDRPWYVNVALFWVELHDGESSRKWALVQLAQNPVPLDERKKNRKWSSNWHTYVIFDARWNPVELFDQPPSASEVEQFLRLWDYHMSGWNYLSKGIRTNTWRRLVGGEPTLLLAWRDAG